MGLGQTRRVPIPTEGEMMEAIAEGREVVGCSAVRYRSLIVLKIAYRNGGIATVCLDPVERSHILRALKALAPELGTAAAAAVTIGALGPQVQLGEMSG